MTPQNIEQLGKKIKELKEITREANGTLKDLLKAKKDIDDYIHKRIEKLIVDKLQEGFVELDRNLKDLRNDLHERLIRQFTKLMDDALGVNENLSMEDLLRASKIIKTVRKALDAKSDGTV